MEDHHDLISDEFLSSLPKDKYSAGDTDVYQFNGCWLRLPELQNTLNFLKHFLPHPSDVILISFPKTGTTWLKSLLFSIINRPSSSKHNSLISTHPHELVQSLEIQVYGPKGKLPLPPPSNNGTRIFSTHLPYQILARSDILSSKNRIVYVTRNPKDTLVSYWHFLRRGKEDPWPLEAAVDEFCRGVVPYGPYYDHVLGYRKESLERPQQVLFITYEELKSDAKNQVKRLGEFLGVPLDDNHVEEIVKSCAFETLKNHEVNKSTDLPTWFHLPYNSFFRTGEVGDHKNYLSSEMMERIDAITWEKFHGSGFMFGI